jgi:hypothetical protein
MRDIKTKCHKGLRNFKENSKNILGISYKDFEPSYSANKTRNSSARLR